MPRIAWEDRDQNLWVVLDGELDHTDCLEIRDEFHDRVQEGEGNLTVVMDGLKFISSMGLGMLVKAAGTMKDQGRTLNLSGIPPNIRKVLDTMRLLDVFAVA